MIRSILALGLAVFLATVQQALADKQCVTEIVSATGKPSSIGELARANAFFTWKAVVKEKFGDAYNAWSEASERKLVCVDLVEGENKGKWECTRSGRPCQRQGNTIVQETTCQKEISQAYGARQRSEQRAREEAQRGWSLFVKRGLGADWADWERAQQKSVDCKKKNSWSYQCIAVAYACKSG